MVFWFLAFAVTAIACAALYYAAAGRAVKPAAAGDDATTAHYRLQLQEINADIASGKLPEAEGVAAKAEMAREWLRQKGEGHAAPDAAASPGRRDKPILLGSIALVAILAFGTYYFLGDPQLPNQPLAGRDDVMAANKLDAAIKNVEAQLVKTPDDVRGWAVLGPIYMRQQRFSDAEHAYRRVLALSKPTADNQTDLAEALMMQQNGDATGEALTLLKAAAALDPNHVRSRFYLAGEATRTGDFANAVGLWKQVIATARGDEPWLATAKNGLATAEASATGTPATGATAAVTSDPAQAAMIKGMVEGLSTRLMAQGGTLDEWTRLVRSRLVLGDGAAAQKAYDAAKLAYPNASARVELDALATSKGLK
jgi:cytochrome c-type biogenesis protein CcmH